MAQPVLTPTTLQPFYGQPLETVARHFRLDMDEVLKRFVTFSLFNYPKLNGDGFYRVHGAPDSQLYLSISRSQGATVNFLVASQATFTNVLNEIEEHCGNLVRGHYELTHKHHYDDGCEMLVRTHGSWYQAVLYHTEMGSRHGNNVRVNLILTILQPAQYRTVDIMEETQDCWN